jgi:hypothetical protein
LIHICANWFELGGQDKAARMEKPAAKVMTKRINIEGLSV